MNITQRRYAIERIFKILSQKCVEISKQDHKDANADYYSTFPSRETILRDIKNGNIKTIPLKNADKAPYKYLAQSPLEAYFNLNHILKDTITSLTNLGYVVDDHGKIESTRVELNSTIKHYKNSYCTRLYHPNSIKKIKKAQKILNNLSDKIMLANEKEVRDAIDKVESIKL